MMKLFGQLLVPPALSVLVLTVLFADWWDSVGTRTRWSVWILVSAGLLLFFQLAGTTIERRWSQKKAAVRQGRGSDESTSRHTPLRRVPTGPEPPADSGYPALSKTQELQVLNAARRVLAGQSDQVKLYRDRGQLVVREVQ